MNGRSEKRHMKIMGVERTVDLTEEKKSVKQMVDLTEEKKMGVKQMVEVKNAYENNGC